MKVNINFYEKQDGKVMASILLDDVIVIHVFIRKNENGEYFVAYPSYKDKDGNYKNSCYAKSAAFNDSVIKEFKKWKNEDNVNISIT